MNEEITIERLTEIIEEEEKRVAWSDGIERLTEKGELASALLAAQKRVAELEWQVKQLRRQLRLDKE